MSNRRHLSRLSLRTLAAASVLVALAALPVAFSGVAGASPADSISAVTFTPNPGSTSSNYFGTGASGSFVISGTFAGDGGNATVTSTAPGLTFSAVTDTTTGPNTTVQGTFASTSATVPGTYDLSVTDDNGSATDPGAFTVNAAPTIASISPATIADSASPSATPTTITGTGFFGTPTVSIVNSTNATKLTTSVSATGGTIGTPATTVPLTVTPTNAVTSDAATIGTYAVTVVNPDGGTATSGDIYTVTGNQITSISPSAIAVPGSGSTTTTITINGSGFESGATASLGTCPGVTFVNGSTMVNGANSATFQVSVASGTTPTQCDVIITNTSPGNGASSIAPAGLGIGEASSMAPVITSSSLTSGTALVAGAGASSIVLTGTGFSPYTTATAYTEYGTTNVHDADAVISGCTETSGTTLTCSVTATTGVTSGAHTVIVENGTATGSFANAFTVAGPVLTSASPTGLAAGAPIGTTVALTGTGFTNTLQGTVATGPLAGNFEYVSPTSANFVVTTSPTTADNNDALRVSTVNSFGATTYSAPLTLSVGAAPTVSTITYATGTTGVGVGAKAVDVTINGTGFVTGATLSGFVNASAVADPDVSGTITAVNTAGTQATAAITIAAGDANTIDGFTITNPNGGDAVVHALAPSGLVIDAAPTITSVTPAKATASATNTFVVVGTGFSTGVVASLSSDGTCSPATAVTSTGLSVACTIGAATTTPVSLVITNLDGGSATSPVLLSSVVAPKAFHVTNPAHGTAIAGKTVTLTISGTGFYGQPKITSTSAGTRVGVLHDNGTLLTIRVTTKAGVAGEHTFTVTEANGKSGKANYAIKK